VVDLAYSYGIVEKLLDTRTAPSNHAAPRAPAASVNAGHANAIARFLWAVFFHIIMYPKKMASEFFEVISDITVRLRR
jgi:hypothetical protein